MRARNLSRARRLLLFGERGYKPGTDAARDTLLKILDNFGETDKPDYKRRDVVLLVRPRRVPALQPHIIEIVPADKQRDARQIRGRLHALFPPFKESYFTIGERGDVIKFVGLPRAFRRATT